MVRKGRPRGTDRGREAPSPSINAERSFRIVGNRGSHSMSLPVEEWFSRP